jgi:hypothetical protein
MWFENWGRDLVELGFAHHNEHGEVIIPDDQLHRILNFDETCLSHDGSNGARGDHPEAKLEELKAMGIDMSHTAVGRLKELRKREAFISVREMNEEERGKMRRSLDEIEAEAALRSIVDTPTEEGAEEGAEHGVNDGEMDAV